MGRNRARTAVVVCRTLGRPVTPQYRRLLNRSHWAEMPYVDLIVAYHGCGRVDDVTKAYAKRKPANVMDLRKHTNGGSFPRWVRSIFDMFVLGKSHNYPCCVLNDYPYVALCDDDFDFIRPADAFAEFYKAMERPGPRVGVVGPLSGYVSWTKYHNDAPRFVRLTERPWTAFGFQLYRAEALRDIDLGFLEALRWRMDVPLFIALYRSHWAALLCRDVSHNHTCSSGLAQKAPDAKFYQQRILDASHDWAATEKLAGNNARLLRDCHGMRDGELRRYLKLCRKAVENERQTD